MTERTLPAPVDAPMTVRQNPRYRPIYLDTYPFLRERCMEVKIFDERLRKIAEAMVHTCAEERGIGLAANQVGVRLRIIVVGVTRRKPPALTPDAYVFVNPELKYRGKKVMHTEGCLSSPGRHFAISRYQRVNVIYQDLDGLPQRCSASGIIAACFQHEVDHLEGILPASRGRTVPGRVIG